MIARKTWLLFALTAVLATQGESMAQRPEPEKEMIDGDPMYTVLPPDRIPAIRNPVFVSAEEAGAWMTDDELVMGVLGPDGEARAYSAWHLDHHEIVNDVIGDVPLAVTW
jgi:hypothetical protein